MQIIALLVLLGIIAIVISVIAKSMSPKEWAKFGSDGIGCAGMILFKFIWVISFFLMVASLFCFLVITIGLAIGFRFQGDLNYFLFSLITLLVSGAGFWGIPHIGFLDDVK